MDKYSRNDTRTILDLEKIPQFGTICSQLDNCKYFVPLCPNDKQKSEIKNCYMSIDSNYRKKETFYIYMNSADERNIGKLIFIIIFILYF